MEAPLTARPYRREQYVQVSLLHLLFTIEQSIPPPLCIQFDRLSEREGFWPGLLLTTCEVVEMFQILRLAFTKVHSFSSPAHSRCFCTFSLFLYNLNVYVYLRCFSALMMLLYILTNSVHSRLFCTFSIILYFIDYSLLFRLFLTF